MKKFLLFISVSALCLHLFAGTQQNCEMGDCETTKSITGRIAGAGGVIGGVREISRVARSVGRAIRDGHRRNASAMRNDAVHRRRMHGMQRNDRGGKNGRSY